MKNKFVENAIAKMNQAYNTKWLEKQFAYYCDLCCNRHLMLCYCSKCPVYVAYMKAKSEILNGERTKSQISKDYLSFYNTRGHQTLVLDFTKSSMKGVTINIYNK